MLDNLGDENKEDYIYREHCDDVKFMTWEMPTQMKC